MISVALAPGADLDGFRPAVRRLVAAGAPPEEVVWSRPAPTLFAAPCRAPRLRRSRLPRRADGADPPRRSATATPSATPCSTPPSGASSTASATCSRSRPTRSSTASSAWRSRCAATCTRCTPSSASAGSRTDGAERFVAWFEPEHFILEAPRRLLRRPLPLARLDDPHPDRLAALGSRRAPASRPAGARARTRRPSTRSRRVARLLRERLQPGAAQPRARPAPRCRRSTGATCPRPPRSRRWSDRPRRALRAMIEKEASHARAPQSREGRRRDGRAGARARSTSSTA